MMILNVSNPFLLLLVNSFYLWIQVSRSKADTSETLDEIPYSLQLLGSGTFQNIG